MILLSLALPIAVIGVVFLLLPNMQRSTLFAVPVDEGFRATPAGHRVVVMYRVWCALALAAALLLCILSPLDTAAELSPLILLLGGAMAFFVARRITLPFMTRNDASQRVMDLTSAPDRLPGWIWLGIGPFLLLALAALFLRDHWSQIPALLPAHFGLNNVADRFVQKSFKGVYGSLLFGGELCVFFFGMSLATWYGARRSSLRPTALAMLLVVEYWMALMFAAAAIQPVAGFPDWLPLVFLLLLPVALLAIFLSKGGVPSEAPRQTPESCWKAGIVYFNPNDPVLFVEKRLGVGYTVNFGNPLSWWFCAGLVAVIATAPVILP